MKLQMLNIICFTICVVCIVAGLVLGLVLIWGNVENSDLFWRAWITLAILFLASLLTMKVNQTFASGTNEKNKE